MSHVYVFPSIHFLPSIFFYFWGDWEGAGASRLCNLANVKTLHVGNVSEASEQPRLAGGAHSPTVRPLPSRQNLELADAWARSPWQLTATPGAQPAENTSIPLPPRPPPPLLSHCTPPLHLSSLFQLDPRLHPLAAYALLFRADTHLVSGQKVSAVNLRESSLLSRAERIHLAVFLLEIPDLIVSTENLI